MNNAKKELEKSLRNRWINMHVKAITNGENIAKTKEHVIGSIDRVECPECQEHAKEFLEKNKDEFENIKNNHEMREWLFNFHNHVSVNQAGNRKISPQEYTVIYWDCLSKFYNMPGTKEEYISNHDIDEQFIKPSL